LVIEGDESVQTGFIEYYVGLSAVCLEFLIRAMVSWTKLDSILLRAATALTQS